MSDLQLLAHHRSNNKPFFLGIGGDQYLNVCRLAETPDVTEFFYHSSRALKWRCRALTPRDHQYFINAGDAWADGKPQDDDVTFVALKVK